MLETVEMQFRHFNFVFFHRLTATTTHFQMLPKINQAQGLYKREWKSDFAMGALSSPILNSKWNNCYHLKNGETQGCSISDQMEKKWLSITINFPFDSIASYFNWFKRQCKISSYCDKAILGIFLDELVMRIEMVSWEILVRMLSWSHSFLWKQSYNRSQD